MSNKSGVDSQVIPLPQGGGALQGIGETFAPDLFTGTGNLTVPIALPPGRAGFAPTVNLVYSTGNGNGPFGLGWAPSVPEICRRTARGVPRYGGADTFVLSGHDDLVPVGGARFRPRTEGAFTRVERLGEAGTGTDRWRVRGRDGLVTEYGAAVTDPQSPSRIYSWRPTGTTDPFGNRIVYEYERDRAVDGPHRFDQLYLRRIRYVDLTGGGFLVSVVFSYTERPDPFSDHRAGFEVRTRRRCDRIEVRTHPDGGDVLVRDYRLRYVDDRVRAGELDVSTLPANNVSLLSQIRVTGHDGGRTEQLPPLEFGYSAFDPRSRRPRPVTGTGGTLPSRSLAHEDLELVDLFGRGLPDIVELNGVARFWRNLGGGTFDRPRQMDEIPTDVHLREPGTWLADLNGNGRTDLLTLNRGGYFPLSFTGRWSREGFVRYRRTPTVPLGDGLVRLVDLDGDGVVDALRTGAEFELFSNDPVEGWSVHTVPRGPAEEFPDVSFADPRVKLADVTGDGLQDIMFVEQGRIRYWPYLGHGRWGRRVGMTGSPVFGDPTRPEQFDPRRVLVGDVDGDGLDDLVYVEANKVTVWINQGGNGWSPPVTITGTPQVTDLDAVRLVDLHGTGSAGILWTDEAQQGGAPYQFVDLTGAAKPYLLTELDNHQGARTRITYASSTESYLADAADPARRWRTPLPFPVQVVARVEVEDELSGGRLSTGYRYHHGYWDGAEREFRGFGLVEQLDTEQLDTEALDGAAPPLLTRTWFHLGPIGEESGERGEADHSGEYWPEDPPVLNRPPDTTALLGALPASERADALRTLRGAVLRTELYALDGSPAAGRPFTVTEAQYGIRREAPGVYFPHPAVRRSTEWDRGTDPMHRFTATGDYDAHGLPGVTVSLGVPRGRDFRVTAPPGEPYLGTRTETRYARRDDDARFIVDRVAHTTTQEVRNDGTPTVFALLDAALAGTARLTVVGRSRTFYDGEPFVGLPLGQLGEAGAPVRTETLVATDAQLREAYGEQLPPYLAADSPQWTADYPEPFRRALAPRAGFTATAGGLVVTSGRTRYGPGGVPIATLDAFGRPSTVGYDRFGLLPERVTDPAGLTVTARYDYRVLRPALVTDVNGNRTAFTFSPLGLLAGKAVMGRDGETDGDSPQRPGTRLVYDFTRLPVSVRTIRRVSHDAGTDDTIETVEFTDGFGRLVQTRAQGEEVTFGDPTFGGGVLPATQDDPATTGPVTGRRGALTVVVSGALVHDNKGRVVERFEPFLATGWDYRPPGEAEAGQRIRVRYDARGRAVRTVNADGSEHLVVHGVPARLDEPDVFEPTPWETCTYDANDNAGRTHPAEAGAFEHHRDTPTGATVDALGRTVLRVERHRAPLPSPGAELPPVRSLRTRFRHDIQGNVLAVVDPLGREVRRSSYDLAGRPLRTRSIDAGQRQTVFDAAGAPVEYRDDRGALLLHVHDPLGRPSRVWARDGAAHPVTLRQRLEYGDAGNPDQPDAERAAHRVANRLGALHRHHDEAGTLTFARYDFKGNVLDKRRQVLADEVVLAAFPAPFTVDWEPPPGTTLDAHAATLLETAEHRTETGYDALNRVTVVRCPRDVEGRRRQLRPVYNRAGALERVSLDGATFVERIAYDAKGQRTLVAYGNGVLARYAYHPRTARMVRLRTERATTDGLTYRPAGAVLQDLAYRHDPVGNLLGIVDRSPGSGVAANPDAGTVADARLRALVADGQALVREFAYDPLYRLTSATGRELSGGRAPLWTDGSAGRAVANQANASSLTTGYREDLTYDDAGNLTRLRHAAGDAVSVRRFDLAPGTNRLQRLTAGATALDYRHDAAGNLVGETDARHFTWDHSARLGTFRVQNGAAEPSVFAAHLYDAAGQRVKKVVRRQGGEFMATTYVDGGFEHHRWTRAGQPDLHNDEVHVADGGQRVALVRIGPPGPDAAGPATQFHLGDHLGNAEVVTDLDGGFVNREEFSPYGETTFGGFARKRFRFTGKERDAESGLQYHGARYYAPWLGRWTACDPLGMVDGVSLYAYAANRPSVLVDKTGLQSDDPGAVVGAEAFVEIRFGNQEASSAVGVKVYGAAQNDIGSAQAGAGFTLTHNYKKAGVSDLGEGQSARGSEWYWNAQLALGSNSGFLGLDAGSAEPLFSAQGGQALSLGIGQRHRSYPGRLREFDNLSGEWWISYAKDSTQGTFYFANDTFWPQLALFGGGTDLGLTTSLALGVRQRRGDSVVHGGLRMDMFTPVPADPETGFLTLDDMPGWKKAKDHPQPGAPNGVYTTTGDFPQLFHGNFYLFGEYRSTWLTARGELGLDSLGGGSWAQRMVHDHLTDSPHFRWTEGLAPYFMGSGTLTGGGHTR